MHTSIPTPHRIHTADGAPNMPFREPDFRRTTARLRAAHAHQLDERHEALERAIAVASTEIPPDIVTMDPRVPFVDVTAGAASKALHVHPDDADATPLDGLANEGP